MLRSFDLPPKHRSVECSPGSAAAEPAKPITLRSATAAPPACLPETAREFERIFIGGIPTVRMTRDALAKAMVRDCRAAAAGALARPRIVVSSNGAVIARYHREPAFRALIEQADIVDADGAPLVIASRLFCSEHLPERVATTDFIHDCCEEAAANGLRFYFLGGRPGVAERAAERLRAGHCNLEIVGVHDGYFHPDEASDLCERILETGANVLWLGLGSPLQEQFAVENRDRLAGLGWIRTCGGLFDHMAGDVRRAPLWMQRAGLEWVWRMGQEPLRLTARYAVTNPLAAYYLLTKTGRCTPVVGIE